MNKVDIISNPSLDMNTKVTIVNIMNRHNKAELCNICEEMVQIMSVSSKELVNDMIELKSDLDDHRNDIDSIRTLVYGLQDDIQDTTYRLSKYEHTIEVIGDVETATEEIKQVRANTLKDKEELSTTMGSLAQVINKLIEYIDTKKTINLRKEPKKPKIVCNELKNIKESIDKYQEW